MNIPRNLIITFLFILIWITFTISQIIFISKSTKINIGNLNLFKLNKESKNYLKEINDKYNKNYAFRKELIHIDGLIQYYFFSLSLHRSVILGKNGWLFLKKGERLGTNYVEGYQNIAFNNHQVESIIKKLRYNNTILQSKGIIYIVVAAPNSASIYREYLPSWVKTYHPYSNLDQVLSKIKNTDLNFIDLRPALIEAKNWKQLYYKTDTHWNAYGAYIAYKTLISQISKITGNNKLIPFSLEKFNINTSYNNCKDLSLMIGHCNIQNEYTLLITNKNPKLKISKLGPIDVISDKKDIEVTNDDITDQSLSVLVFRDSFFIDLIPYLVENFYYSYFVWQPFELPRDLELINKIKPRYVIHEFVERHLKYME